jgi:hypothetical protein
MKLTDYLAIYGALLSTTVFVWNAVKARPKVRVRLAFAVETKDGQTQTGLGVSIQNPSAHTVHITAASFLYPYSEAALRQRLEHIIRYKRVPFDLGWCYSGFSLYDVEDGCPVSIEPGASHYIMVPQDKLEQLLANARRRILKVSVQDALWRNKKSRAFAWPKRTNAAG